MLRRCTNPSHDEMAFEKTDEVLIEFRVKCGLSHRYQPKLHYPDSFQCKPTSSKFGRNPFSTVQDVTSGRMNTTSPNVFASCT
jgi:hypothetical protein